MNRGDFFIGILALGLALLCGTACDTHEPEDTLFVEKHTTGIDFRNDLRPSDSLNIISYLYYYNGGGVAVGDINNDQLPDIFFTANQGPNRLYLNQGDWQFQDITDQAGIAGAGQWSTGASMADVNGDGWLDIFVSNVCGYRGLTGGNEMWINQGDGTFADLTATYGLDFCGFGTQVYWLDYDRDGDLDAYQLNHSVHSAENYGRGSLRNIVDARAGDRLWRQDQSADGNPVFVDVSAEAGIYQSKIGYGLSASLADFNDDGWPDIYVANDFHENDYLYLNQQDGTFRESLTEAMGHTSNFSMGTDAADFDNDGHIDLFSLDMKPSDETILKSTTGPDPYNIFRFKLKYGYHPQFARNHLQWNQGDGQFSEIAELSGIAATDWSWSALFADLDLDGQQDLFITNGIKRRPNDLDYLKFTSNQELQSGLSDAELAARMPDGAVANVVYQNKDELGFEDVSAAWGLAHAGYSNGAAYADFDADGDLDLVINHLDEAATIYENHATDKSNHHWISLQFPFEQQAIGTRAVVYSQGKRWTRELFPQKGFLSSSQSILHFGVGKLEQIDSVLIRWPEGHWQKFTDVSLNQSLLIKRENGVATENPYTKSASGLWEEVKATGLDYVHQENEYTDFDVEGLLPHALSRMGPAVAVSEEEAYVYLGGAHGQTALLYRIAGDGHFVLQDTTVFALDKQYEDVAATFFDADGDGDQDLYVVSGGGGLYEDNTIFTDRLYLQSERGWGRDQQFAGPAENGSCVVAADFDQDGDPDLFVGARSVPGAYGAVPASRVLLNDGEGNFTADQNWQSLSALGMVSAAVWLPQETTLAVVGEWMPVTLLQKKENSWHSDTLTQTRGWWNTIHATDINQDGVSELVLGNLGWNTSLQKGVDTKPKLFIADFDENGQLDPLLTYQKEGADYSFYWKDQLSAQIPGIRRRNVAYAEFAKQALPLLLGPENLAKAKTEHLDLTASVWLQKNTAGAWELYPLPPKAQTTPIFAVLGTDLDQDGKTDILAAGNWFDQQPALGRLDAGFGYVLQQIGSAQFTVLAPKQSGMVIRGEVRAIRQLADGRILVVRNDDKPLLFQRRK